MKIVIYRVGIVLLSMLIGGCAARDRGHLPDSAGSSSTSVVKEQQSTLPEAEPVVKVEEPVVSKSMATVTAHRLNLRAKSSAKSDILGVLKKGDRVEIRSQNGKWFQVQSKSGRTGWVFGRYIKPIGDAAEIKREDSGTVEKKPPARRKKKSADEKARESIPVPPPDTSEKIKSVQTVPGKKTGAQQAENPSKAFFIKLYSDVHRAIVDGDLDTIEKLVIPADPSAPRMKPDQFDMTKEMLLNIYPAFSSTKLIKFESGDQKALLVLQVMPEDTESIDLSGYHFIKKDDEWKLSGKVKGAIFPRENEADDRAAIDKELKENPFFQLGGLDNGAGPDKGDGEEAPTRSPRSSDEAMATANFAKGFLEVNGKKVELNHAYVDIGKDPFDESKKAYQVYLTDIPVPGKDWQEKINDLAWNGKLQYVKLTIDQSKHIISMVMETPLLDGGNISSSGGHTFKAKTFGPTVLEGSAFSGSKEFGGQQFSYRITFRVILAGNGGEKSPESLEASSTETQDAPVSTKTAAFSDNVVDRFFLSIMEGDIETVKGFLDAGMSPNVKRPRLGHSPLFSAITAGHDDMALMLIKRGADVNFTDNSRSTPLMWAARNCRSIRLVKALVNAGADVNAKAKGGNTPLQSAEIFRCGEIADLLKSAGAR